MTLTSTTRALINRTCEGLLASHARLFGNYTLRTTAGETEPNWTVSEAEQRRSDALRIASAAVAADRSGEHDLARMAYRRAAELLEWLEPESLDDEGILLSAAFYQLAELPAMARSILRELDARPTLYSTFLSGDFSAFESISQDDLTYFGTSPDSDVPSDLNLTIRRHIVSALNVVVAQMRWGDGRLDVAHKALEQGEAFFELSRQSSAWLLALAFRKIAKIYADSSLREVTKPLFDRLSPSGQGALERYLREAYIRGRPIAWPTQRAGLLKLAENTNFALCTPTGSGKTTVAEIAILQALYEGTDADILLGVGRLALYIVPSRALAAEVEDRLRRAFADDSAFSLQVIASYGGIDVSASEHWVNSQRPAVLVCTQEKADALVRATGHLFVNRLRLIIIDEAHNVDASAAGHERSLRLESLIARLRMLRGDECV